MAEDVCRCGNAISQPARGPKRQWCTTCRPPKKWPPKSAAGPALAVLPPPSAEAPSDLGPVARATLAELGDRAGSASGAAALRLATLLDTTGGAAAASLAKAHGDALARAMRDAGEDADVITAAFGA